MANNQCTSSSIYINPKFKNAHINPNFLNKKPLQASPSTNIYINPKFLNRDTTPSPPINHFRLPETTLPASADSTKAKIISKTNRKLVRQPIADVKCINTQLATRVSGIIPLIKIGKRKLVRASNSTSNQRSTNIAPLISSVHKVLPNGRIHKLGAHKIVRVGALSNRTRYKIDRRDITPTLRPSLPIDRTRWRASSSFASRPYHLLNENLGSTKVIITNHRLQRIGNTPQKQSATSSSRKWLQSLPSSTKNKKLELLNINGVYYKSTKNKLQKHESATSTAAKAATLLPKTSVTSPNRSQSNRMLIVRGEKFFLDAGGKKLRRAGSEFSTTPCTSPAMKRIDIGGLTYIAKSNNTYERTDFHKSRVHLAVAKQKSIHLLSKRFTKSYVPCAIFQKLGKCRALERGRCTKVHDPKHVAICQKFLKGNCILNENCLLSHSVTLSKMPTCKFYLLGICSKSDCPYLHKKVSDKTEICSDFLRGFCEKAEKCHKRHEFLCPDFESKGKCEKARCPYTHKSKAIELIPHRTKPAERATATVTVIPKSIDVPSIEIRKNISKISLQDHSRYFDDDDDQKAQRAKRTKLSASGKAKLSRVLTKVNQMKANLNLCTGNSSLATVIADSALARSDEIDDGLSVSVEVAAEEDDGGIEQLIPQRPKLGPLPSYIPIE